MPLHATSTGLITLTGLSVILCEECLDKSTTAHLAAACRCLNLEVTLSVSDLAIPAHRLGDIHEDLTG